MAKVETEQEEFERTGTQKIVSRILGPESSQMMKVLHQIRDYIDTEIIIMVCRPLTAMAVHKVCSKLWLSIPYTS